IVPVFGRQHGRVRVVLEPDISLAVRCFRCLADLEPLTGIGLRRFLLHSPSARPAYQCPDSICCSRKFTLSRLSRTRRMAAFALPNGATPWYNSSARL